MLFLVIAVAIAALAGAFSGGVWTLGDTRRFFEMADVILRGGTPYVDFKDPKPPLVFFLLTVPEALGAGMAGGLLLVALANFSSAAIILAIGWRSYGRDAGLLAGLLFVVNMAWAEGYFVLTEPFALTFTLLSAYILLFGDRIVDGRRLGGRQLGSRDRYLLAGVCAGIAIGFKQYALLLLPIALFYVYRKREMRAFGPYLAGALLPLAAVFAVVFLLFGANAGAASLYWSFGMAPEYITTGTVGDIPAYRIGDPVIAASWVALALGLFMPLTLLAAAGALRWKPGPEEELFIVAAVAFAATLLIRPFLHYWTFSLPFAVLLLAGALHGRKVMPWPRLPDADGAFALMAGAIFAALLAVSTLVTAVVMDGRWRPQALVELYGLADIVLKATAPYFGHVPAPAALQLAFPLPASLLALAVLGLITATVVFAIAWRLYGRGPALLAGMLCAMGVAFALGYMQPSDGVAVLLLALSSYLLVTNLKGKFLCSGLLMGVATAIMPFAIGLPFAALLVLPREKLADVAAFFICVLAPIALLVLASPYGGPLLGVYWGPALSSLTTGYHVPDALMAMLNLAAAGSFVTSTIIVAVAAFLSKKASPFEAFLLAATALLCGTLLFAAFTHYWFVALPFAAVLCAGLFSGDQKVIMARAQ